MHFQDPEPLDFNPKKGPRSGGTNVNITGNNMNTGRYITVQVAGRQCLVDRNKLVSMFNVLLFDVCKSLLPYFHVFTITICLWLGFFSG